ncbi:hypothetical protein M1N64_05055, partial [Peptococcaceae bacterium]|nr:hypothetical protein [Peptococcaceae bacterium]
PGGWLVHVHELKKGDLVEIYPSQFDFEFLSASAQRFEVTYNKDGKRQEPIKANRPYLIEQLDQFEYIWQVIRTNLSTSQIKHINGLIETKRIAWQISGENTVFEKFVYDIFCNAEWKNGIPAEINELIKSAVKGELRDILELYNTILKSGKGDE